MHPQVLARWFAASPNPYMVLDRELRYIAANPAYLEVTGTTLDALIGRRLFDLFPHDPEDPDNEPRRLLAASLEKVLATRDKDVLAYLPYRVPRGPGLKPELRIWSATHIPILDAHGEVEAILQHTEDVTELHREQTSAAAVLSRAEHVQRDYVELGARLRGLVEMLDQAPGFMAFLRGPEHVLEFANRAYQRFAGGRPLIGLSVRQALPDLADQGYFELLDRVYATREPFVGRGMRIAMQPPGGELHDAWVDFVYQPILGPDGQPYGILVQGHEVTEIVRARLRDQFRTRASEILAGAGDDIERALGEVAWAATDTIADWAFVDLFEDGASRRLVVAHADLDRTEDADALRRYPLPVPIPASHPLHGLDRSPRLTRSVTPELLAGAARGPEHLALVERLGFVSVLTVPLRHRDRLYGVLALLTAQSHRRYDDDDLAAVAELGHVLSTAFDNARLSLDRQALLAAAEDARERAEAASRSKDEFLAMLGHELRNPLAPILSAVELLRVEPQPAGERMLRVIERQARHLVRLVDDMLDVSRIVHGKLELRRTRVEAATVVNKAIEIAMVAIESKKHRLEVSPIPDAAVFGDEARIAQVLANILTNAARYTPAGGLVQVRTELEGEDVVFRVRDDGVGIDADILPRVFDLFVQAPRPADRSEGGLGLGLTLVNQLVKMHGGTVEATSEGPGRGTEVTVRLPRHLAPDRATERGHEAQRTCQSRRILVVDDNVDAAELLAVILERAGHRVDVCHDGFEALSRAVSEPPNLAIIDLGLPGMDGLELAARMRERLGERAPGLVAVTGYGGAEHRSKTARIGFQAHLTKPIDTAELLRLVDELDAR